MKKAALICLIEYHQILRSICHAISTSNAAHAPTSSPTLEELMKSLVQKDAQLKSLLAQMEERQAFQRTLDSLQDQLTAENQDIGFLYSQGFHR